MARNLDYAVSKRLRQGSERWKLDAGQRRFFDNCLKEIEKLEFQVLDKQDSEQRLRGELYEGAELREQLRKFLGL